MKLSIRFPADRLDPAGKPVGYASLRDLIQAQGDSGELLGYLRDHPVSAELLGRVLGTSQVAGELLVGQPKGIEWLREAGAFSRRRSAVFVVSDFISAPGWEQPLGRMALRHDVLAVRLFDPLELHLPDLGLLPLYDAETGERLWVDTHDAGFRERFQRLAAEREAQLAAIS